ncbi:GTPase [Candidatus Hodgkinia cicadicola]|uniref:tRNA modification GTPase MnmE n=1 Tax=Candidatus Hodgkinia cicadicola TaxID=573658 RepID=A0ABX4MJA9_9HYPH|nr:tRNA modification GTPase MnmE [Candidatus Hodgkinia cicadicola]
MIRTNQNYNHITTSTIYATVSDLPCAIAIIRLSGPLVLKTLNECIDELLEPDSWRTSTLTDITSPINKCTTRWQPSPNSPTGEDYAELHVFGLRTVVNVLTNKFKGLGLKQANRGEFTKRGLKNNKISSKEVIEIASHYGLKIKSSAINNIKTAFKTTITKLELTNHQNISVKINQLTTRLTNLIKTSIKLNNICLVGNTNVGKSSLFNAISKRTRAIVDNVKGTTRDVLKTSFRDFNLWDTPGFNQRNINSKFITNAWTYIDNAGVIAMVNNNQPPKPFLRLKHKAAIILIESKSDLIHKLPKQNDVIWTSAYTMEGIPQTINLFKQLTRKSIITPSQITALTLLKKCNLIKNIDTKFDMLKLTNKILNNDNDETTTAHTLTNYLCYGK